MKFPHLAFLVFCVPVKNSGKFNYSKSLSPFLKFFVLYNQVDCELAMIFPYQSFWMAKDALFGVLVLLLQRSICFIFYYSICHNFLARGERHNSHFDFLDIAKILLGIFTPIFSQSLRLWRRNYWQYFFELVLKHAYYQGQGTIQMYPILTFWSASNVLFSSWWYFRAMPKNAN